MKRGQYHHGTVGGLIDRSTTMWFLSGTLQWQPFTQSSDVQVHIFFMVHPSDEAVIPPRVVDGQVSQKDRVVPIFVVFREGLDSF